MEQIPHHSGGREDEVYLNDVLVVDHAILENYFDKERKTPLIAKGPVQLQTHGNEVRWKNIYVRELSRRRPMPFSARTNAATFNGYSTAMT